MRDFSGLGSTAVLVLFTAAYLVLSGARTTALVVATAVITGWVGVSWLKAGFAGCGLAQTSRNSLRPG